MVFLLCFAGSIIQSSAADQQTASKYPDEFVRAAAAFKSASPTNRFAEAQAVLDTLPRCPSSKKDVGTGTYRTYDFSQPSYVLPSSEVLNLLGNPLVITTNIDLWGYSYEIRGPEKWLLYIRFKNDYAVLSGISSYEQLPGRRFNPEKDLGGTKR
jgi:hypothetical protein